MKMIASTPVLLAISLLLPQVEASFRPYRLSYESMVEGTWDRQELENALSGSGMVALTGLHLPRGMIENQHACLYENAGEVVEAPDGTVRYTVATETIGGALQPLLAGKEEDPTCATFLEESKKYRSQVKEAVKLFSQGLGEIVVDEESAAVEENGDSEGTIADLVSNGRHLEHFHSYVKSVGNQDTSSNTLDWHVDQGLFLAFVPGRWSRSGETTQGFFVRTTAGTTEEVDFEDDVSLVFMLGDGVNRHINNNISATTPKLRAVPHALQVPASNESRVWYGLMVLPPAKMSAQPGDALAIGCTEGTMTARSGRFLDALEHANHTDGSSGGNHTNIVDALDEFGCVMGGEVYCWHRCMKIEEFLTDKSPTQCVEEGKTVACINPRLEMWEGKRHGDYYPGCVAEDTQLETPFPTLPDFPREDDECANFADFVASDASEYDHEMPLLDRGNATVGFFQWTVEDAEDGGKSLSGRVTFNGIFGFLAFGLAGEDGKQGHTYHMLNAPIIMALPGSNYTAFAGLDLDLEPTVAEYATELRSLMQTDRNYTVTFDECYTAMTFSNVKDIAGSSLDLEGTDLMIWGANNQDTFVQYHGTNRKVFEIEWNGEESLIANKSAGHYHSSVLASLVVAALWIVA